MAAQDKYPPYKVTAGTSLLADAATRGFQAAAFFVCTTGVATLGAGIVLSSCLAILVGVGIALVGGALIWIAYRARRRHEDAIAAAIARRQAKKAAARTHDQAAARSRARAPRADRGGRAAQR